MKGVAPRIGFMQGRLVPPVMGKIQAFPWDDWREEFRLAREAGFALMEWTLDRERMDENPIMTPEGRAEIHELSRRHEVTVASLTGDCFMHAPFHKAPGGSRDALLGDLVRVIEAAGAIGVRQVVVPLVDGGRLESAEQETVFCTGIEHVLDVQANTGVRLLVESDYPPRKLQSFMAHFPAAHVGVNYDIGNSASMGFDPGDEIVAFGSRIENVHVKDRRRGGSTVPFGKGAADFPRVFGLLSAVRYTGNFILQPARAADGDHVGLLRRYRDMVQAWVEQAA